jgi:hypothetical protein
MAINISQAFHRTSANPIDDTLALTKAEMLTVNDNLMPNKYLTVCQDDGQIYLYDKAATASADTGKFVLFKPSNDYSTDEKVVGTWLDGKPLYQRTFSGTLPTIASKNTYEMVQFSLPSIALICEFKGLLIDNVFPCIMPIPTISDLVDAQIKAYYDITIEKLVVKCNVPAWSGKDFYITIQYTKTTD